MPSAYNISAWSWPMHNLHIPVCPVVHIVGVGNVKGVRSQCIDDPTTSPLIVHALYVLGACVPTQNKHIVHGISKHLQSLRQKKDAPNSRNNVHVMICPATDLHQPSIHGRCQSQWPVHWAVQCHCLPASYAHCHPCRNVPPWDSRGSSQSRTWCCMEHICYGVIRRKPCRFWS